MLPLWFAPLLLGYSFLANLVTAINVTTGVETPLATMARDEASVPTTTTPSSKVPGDALCSSYISKSPGSSLRPAEEAVISCQCSDSACPVVDFLNGEEFIFKVETKFDLSSDSCSLQYTFRLRSHLKVGRERVTINCKVPDTEEVFGTLEVYTDTPEPPSGKPRLGIYVILGIVAFLLLALLFLGFLLRRLIRSRRRTQRNAACRNPFVQSQTNYAYGASEYPGPNGDSPPSYNEATLAHNLAGLSKGALAMNEKVGKPSTKGTEAKQVATTE